MTEKQKYQAFYILSIIFILISMTDSSSWGLFSIGFFMLAMGYKKEAEYKKSKQ